VCRGVAARNEIAIGKTHCHRGVLPIGLANMVSEPAGRSAPPPVVNLNGTVADPRTETSSRNGSVAEVQL
jgi:hypothetical protein